MSSSLVVMVNGIPGSMGLEVAAGEALSFVLGNELVCMRASKAPR